MPECEKKSVEGKQRACVTDKLLPKTTHGKCKPYSAQARQGKNNISAEPSLNMLFSLFHFEDKGHIRKLAALSKLGFK